MQCCISYFLMNFSFYMLMPTMPVYLVEVLGISTANVGIALSSYTIGLLCVRPFSGFLVDCFSRKPLYLFAFFVFAFMFGGYLIATTMLTIMAVRFVQGGFMGLTSVAGNTIAIDVIPSSRRGEGMGFYGLTINLAMSLAPLAAVAIYGKGGFNLVVFIGWMAAFIGVGSVCLIRYPKREKVPRPHFSLDRFILVKALPAALAYILVAIPYGMITSFVVLYGKEIEVANPGYFFIYMAGSKKGGDWKPRKDSRKGSENRQPTGARERNKAHPNGEEHSRVPKGNGLKRYDPITLEKILATEVIIISAVFIVYLVANVVTGVGVIDDAAIIPVAMIIWEAAQVFA